MRSFLRRILQSILAGTFSDGSVDGNIQMVLLSLLTCECFKP